MLMFAHQTKHEITSHGHGEHHRDETPAIGIGNGMLSAVIGGGVVADRKFGTFRRRFSGGRESTGCELTQGGAGEGSAKRHCARTR